MTRAQGLRSSKRKPVTPSQDIFSEYCKENSPSILSQDSRRAVRAKKNSGECKENNLASKRKPVKTSQDIILEYCKENSPSILSQNSRRAVQSNKKFYDCKKNNLPRCSKRKSVGSTQEIIPEYCKENLPSIICQNFQKLVQSKTNSNDSKDNILPNGSKKIPVVSRQGIIPKRSQENPLSVLSQNSVKVVHTKKKPDDSKENIFPKGSRKSPEASIQEINYLKGNSPSILSQSSRRAVQAKKKPDDFKENILPNGLSSSSKLTPVITNQECYSPIRRSRRHTTEPKKKIKIQPERNVLNDTTNSLQPGLNRNNIFHKIITVPQPGTSSNNNNADFENHIPVYKTACPLKPLNGAEAISEKKEAVYEFEVDENEEPVVKKKRKKRAYIRKPKIGPKALTINNIKYSSTESLASLPEKPISKKKPKFEKPKCSIKPCSSVATLDDSCVSVPSFMSHPVLPLRDNRCELSVLQETQSEQCPTPESTPLETTVSRCPSSSSAVPATLSHSHHIHFSPNPRCYGSKSDRTPNPYNDDQNVFNDCPSQQASSSATNVSTSSHDFLSSTPCKRFSLVGFRNNSVFDDSPGMRSSPGLNRDVSSLTVADDNCFGFDEPDELEEPLVSPIKIGIDLQPRRIVKCIPESYHQEEPKPSIQEVIELLKANIPKPAAKKDTTMFVTSPQSSEPVSPTVEEEHSPVFVKPARRSYERQRRVQYYNSESEEEEENTEEPKDNATSPPKENKKCYKKANVTKTARAPKVTKAKQRIAKEEEELEKMAALMNAQFQEIDKVDLVVE